MAILAITSCVCIQQLPIIKFILLKRQKMWKYSMQTSNSFKDISVFEVTKTIKFHKMVFSVHYSLGSYIYVYMYLFIRSIATQQQYQTQTFYPGSLVSVWSAITLREVGQTPWHLPNLTKRLSWESDSFRPRQGKTTIKQGSLGFVSLVLVTFTRNIVTPFNNMWCYWTILVFSWY